MNELFEKAAAGDLAAIILWEWLNVYQDMPETEVNEVLEMIEDTSSGTITPDTTK